jgi:hypothetical protein
MCRCTLLLSLPVSLLLPLIAAPVSDTADLIQRDFG